MGETGRKSKYTISPMRRKHQNTCFQTTMMLLVSQSMGFQYALSGGPTRREKMGKEDWGKIEHFARRARRLAPQYALKREGKLKLLLAKARGLCHGKKLLKVSMLGHMQICSNEGSHAPKKISNQKPDMAKQSNHLFFLTNKTRLPFPPKRVFIPSCVVGA